MDERYVRQVILPQIGKEGQKKLSQARVLVVGLGALGTYTAGALLRAGVKKLVLVDRDVVEIHNLHRTLYSHRDVGRPKAEAAAVHLRRIDKKAELEVHVCHLDPALAEEIVPDVDIVVDGLDNLESRYVVNDACVKHKIPYIYTAVLATYGMMMPILPMVGPCLRCLFPFPPSPGALPTCATAGILGPLPQAMAAYQAVTTIQVILRSPDLRPGELLHLDIWTRRMNTITVERAPDCPACQRGIFEFLAQESRVAILCGDAIQVFPRVQGNIDLTALAARLEPLGEVRLHHGLLLAEIEGISFIVFPDGRALIKGVKDPNRAQTLYDQYLAR